MLLMLTDMRDFDAWLAGFRPSIADYKYYVDLIRYLIMWKLLKFHSIS